jgi:hypothetical protein
MMNLILLLSGYLLAGFTGCLLVLACVAYAYQHKRHIAEKARLEFEKRTLLFQWSAEFEVSKTLSDENARLRRQLAERELYPEYING